MDEKELEALFSILKENTGISTKESLSHIISQGGIEVVYDEIQEGIFNDIETFVGAFNSSKKKEEGSVSESGTSDGFNLEEFLTPTEDQFAQPQVEEDLAAPQKAVEKDVLEEVSRQRTKEIEKQTLKKQIEEGPRIIEQLQEEQRRIDEVRGSEELSFDINSINDDFLRKEAEELIPQLTKKYGKYGIMFTPGRKVDGTIIARTSDGKKQIKIRTTNEFEDNDHEVLKEFIAANAAPIEEVKDQDFLTKSFNVKKSRPTEMLNEDGSVSTVVMSSADNIAFPTIFPKDPDSESKDPKDWHVFDTSTREGVEKAIAMAEERGEIYKFETDEEANDFAEGSWKDVKYSDLEGDKFFKEKNLDYATIMKSEKRYNAVKEEIAFISAELGMRGGEYNFSTGEIEGDYKPSEKEIKDRPDIFLPDGRIRSDVKDKLSELQKEEEELFQLLRGDEKTSLAIDEYNLYLHKKFQTIGAEAAKKNNDLKKEIEIVSQEWNNLTPEQQKNQLEEHNLKISALKDAQDGLSDDYFLAKTYLNEKTRQEISKDFEEDFAALASSVKEGYNNGSAASILLAISLGMKDADKATAQDIAYYLNNMNDTQSRALTRYQQGSTKESWNALFSSPVEVVTSMIASSLSQTIPIGLTLLSDPKIAAAIGTVGVVKGAKGGALGIAKSSLSTLQAASEFALEYSNAILDQAREAGYNVNDPKQMLKAMQDTEVIRKGHEIGIKRGAAISGVSFLGSELSGKVFTVSKTAGKGKKAAAFVGERIIYDPAIEAAGELAAQVASGQKISTSDIFDEYISGPFQNTATAAISVFRQNDKQSKINFAYDLTKIDEVAKATESNNRLSDWSTEMHRLGQIDDSVNNAIHENLTLKERANDLLNLSKSKKTDKVRTRTMELLKAQKTLGKDDNSKKIYKEELSKIDEELSYMVKEGKLAPDSKTVDISNVKDPAGEIVSMASTPKSYKINGKRYTKAEFKKKYDRLSDKKKKKATFEIKNDPEFKSQINQEAGIMPSTSTTAPTTTTTQVTDTNVTAIAEQSFGTIDEVPDDIRESATVIQQQEDGTFQVNDENYATIDAVPQEVMASDAVITQKQDGSVDVKYNEDKFTIEAAPIMDTFESMDQIPQNIKDAASTQIVENDKGEFEVTYKEAEVLAQQMGKQKSEPRFRAKEKKKARADIEKRRKAELKEWKRDTGDLNAAWAVGSTQTIKEHINAKYDAELAALDSQTKTLEKDGKQETTKKPVAGNRLFNEPLQDATKIADRITKRKGIDTPRNEKIKKLNKERATKIAEAYENMEHRPNDPDVREAYNTLIDETIEQYEAIIEEGYAMEINNDDSYGNSKEMIEDLKDRKRMKVFSTESGFGSDGITDEMRKDNPMLAKTEYKDANGVPLLVNDIFRFVHDFFGHAKQGNGFGPLGEENAWNIHSQMYSPTARKALTTETRGQNSWVNFSKVNEEAFKIRDEARALRKVGKLDEALKKVEEAYAMMKFAEQKIGLLPEEYTNTDAEIDSSDPRFRLKEGEGRIAEDKKLSADVKKKQKAMSKAEKDFMVPRGKPVREDVNPLAESRSETKLTEEDAQAMGFNSVADMTKKIEDFEGMPMGVVMSDHLAAGTHRDSAGDEMQLGGGILFNTLGAVKNRLLAWAGIDKNGANTQYQEAKMIYKANKELFHRLWAEKKLPYGHVPFAVAKMGETAMDSNEAVFRWLSPKVKQLEKKYKSRAKSAFNALVAEIESLQGLTPEGRKKLAENKTKLEADPTNETLINKIEKAEERQAKQIILNFIKKNKIKTVSQLLDAIVEDSKKRAKDPKTADLALPARAFVFGRIFLAKSKIPNKAKPSKKWQKELLRDSKNVVEDFSYFVTNSDNGVRNQITEPSMLEGRQGDIVAVVGIKVLKDLNENQQKELSKLKSKLKEDPKNEDVQKKINQLEQEAGGVAQTDHTNYGFGPEGKFIAFLSNPMHGTDVFAEWEVKSARVFKQDKAGKVPSKTNLMTQIGGAFFIDKAFRGMKVSMQKDSSQKRKVVDLLVAKMRHAFPSVGITSTQAEFDAIMESDNVRTRVKDGMVVYGITLDGNIYLNPEAVDVATPIHEFGHIWIDYLRHKALESPKGKAAKLLAKGLELAKTSNKKRYNEYKKKYGDSELAAEELLVELMATRGETIVNESLKAKFKEWFNAFFKYIKQTFKTSEKVTLTEIKELTIEEFANIGLADLFGGTLLDGKFDPSTITDAMRARFSMETSDGSNMSLSDTIANARQEGYSDRSIKDYLKTQGYKVAEINKAMAIQLDINTKMPEAFTNVFGGAKEGIQMFNDIKKKLDNWVKSRWGKGKSFTEYRTKAMELLSEHDLYKAQKSIDQQKLMSGMDTVIGRKKVKDINTPIKAMKDTLKLIKNNNWKGNLNAVKKGLGQALTPLKGSKIHSVNQKKIAAIIKSIKIDNIDTKIKEIDSVLSDIMKDNKEINSKINNDISLINKKIEAFSKGQADRSKKIKEITSLVKGLTKGTRFGNIFGNMITEISGIKESNADVKFDKILGLISDFYAFQQMSADKVTGLESAINNLKEKIKTHKKQARELADIKLKVAQNIKEATQQLRDLGIKEYRYSDVQKLVYKVNNARIGNIDKVLAQVSEAFDKVEERGRKKKISHIKTFIKIAAKTKNRSGRIVGKDSVSADGQKFFDTAAKFLKILSDDKISLEKIKEALDIREELKSYTKDQREEALRSDESIEDSVPLIKAFDKMFGDNPLLESIPETLMGIDTMSLEELNALQLELKGDKMVFAVELANKKALEKDIRDQKIAQASEQIKDAYEILYNKETVDGETVMTPKNSDELKRIKNPFKKIFKEEGVRAAFKSMLDKLKLSNFIAGNVGHLTAICSILDNLPDGKDFFTENIVNRLNRAQSRFVKGLQDQKDKLDSLAASVNPNLSYDRIKNKIFKTAPLKIGDITYSGDQLVRLYALLKNDVQKQKLMKENGFTSQDIANINNSLDPDVKAFADMVVDYLSSEYYNQTNNVYKDVNNVNLPKIDNYFPTQTVSDKASNKENIKALAEMSTGKLSAQGESFLKQRTNTKGAVAMMKSEGIPHTFTDSLDTLMEGSERFKAYASDAKQLNGLLSSTEIGNLLKMTGLNQLVNNFINNAVQPITGKDGKLNRITKWMFSNYIGVRLGYKLFQIPKQASSAVMAFPQYENNLTKKLPPFVKLFPDLIMFSADLARVIINPSAYKKAYDTSPMFRERVSRFRKGGFSSLETTITEEQANNFVTKGFRKVKQTGEAPTFIGDMMGVMGYWANYERDIKNGMDPKKALEKFENYNKTQQTQRATEINKLQLASKEQPLLMALTTFASTPFLMQSLILESVDNIMKQTKKAKGIKKLAAPINGLLNTKDGLTLLFALGVGNAMFAAVSNIYKLIYGTEEDEEDFVEEVTKAATGFNTIASLPFLGPAIESAYAAYQGENMYGSQDIINPYTLVAKEFFNSYKEQRVPFLPLFHSPKEKDPFLNVLIKYTTGINTDPMIGMYQFLQGEQGAGFKAVGVSKSYLPKEIKSFLEGGEIVKDPTGEILE